MWTVVISVEVQKLAVLFKSSKLTSEVRIRKARIHRLTVPFILVSVWNAVNKYMH
jgi:hypothetical protein